MKRKFLVLSFTLLLLVSLTTISYSSTKIIESPHIVIDINSYFIKQMTAFSNTISRFEGEDYLKHYTDYDSHYNKLDDNYKIPNPVDDN